MFWTSKDSEKRKWYAFSGYKQKNKICFVYLLYFIVIGSFFQVDIKKKKKKIQMLIK